MKLLQIEKYTMMSDQAAYIRVKDMKFSSAGPDGFP